MLSCASLIAIATLQTEIMNSKITSTNLSRAAVEGISTTLVNLENAWNKTDIDLYSQQLGEQCHWVNVVGMWWRGKPNVVKAHAVFFELMFKGVHQSYQKIDLRGLTDTVAVAICTIKLGAYKTPDGRTFPESLNRLTMTMVHRGDRWLIESAQNTIVDPKATPFNPIEADKDKE
jgi:uncharacterized protein (TIGR02246 family)